MIFDAELFMFMNGNLCCALPFFSFFIDFVSDTCMCFLFGITLGVGIALVRQLRTVDN
jgi:hypothetical protein